MILLLTILYSCTPENIKPQCGCEEVTLRTEYVLCNNGSSTCANKYELKRIALDNCYTQEEINNFNHSLGDGVGVYIECKKFLD